MLPSIADIQIARTRLAGQSVETPLMWSTALNDLVGGSVLLKAECLQRTGTFKFRGAYNAIAGLDDNLRQNGVVACSSGNHAQGVAEAARLFGIDATIVMPADAPQMKINRTRGYGAHVITYDRFSEDRLEIAHSIAAKAGASFIHPYDNADVIAGQGTTGLEILEQAERLGHSVSRILVCTGGGGLTAGVAMAAHAHDPDIEIYAVEPSGFDDHQKSLKAKTRVMNETRGGSVCDALLAEQPGALTFEINKDHLKSGLAVSDNEALAAVKFAFEELKLVVEPGGAVTLAALLNGRVDVSEGTTVAIISGGNIDASMLSRAIAA